MAARPQRPQPLTRSNCSASLGVASSVTVFLTTGPTTLDRSPFSPLKSLMTFVGHWMFAGSPLRRCDATSLLVDSTCPHWLIANFAFKACGFAARVNADRAIGWIRRSLSARNRVCAVGAASERASAPTECFGLVRRTLFTEQFLDRPPIRLRSLATGRIHVPVAGEHLFANWCERRTSACATSARGRNQRFTEKGIHLAHQCPRPLVGHSELSRRSAD